MEAAVALAALLAINSIFVVMLFAAWFGALLFVGALLAPRQQ